MNDFLQDLWVTITNYLPTLLLAIGILIIGWLIAWAVSSLIRSLLRRTTLDDRLAAMIAGEQPGQTTDRQRVNVEKWISTGVFWVIILFTVLAFLQALNLTVTAGPFATLLNRVLAFVPGILIALVLLLVAWVVATLLRFLIIRLFTASGLAERLAANADMESADRRSLGQTIGNVVYWLVFLLFLPAILDALNLQGLLQPVQQVVNQILGVLPNLLGAAVIFAIGWLVARIVRQLVVNILSGIGIDRLGAEAGVTEATGRTRISDLIGLIVYILILIPVAIAALNTLNIPAISEPATNMLNLILVALPAIFGALLLLGIAYFIARLVGNFVASILAGIGFDRLFNWMGLFRTTGNGGGRYTGGRVGVYRTPVPGRSRDEIRYEVKVTNLTPSRIIGHLTTIAIVLFAAMEAADLLGFEFLANLISSFIVAAGQVLVGLIVFGIGLYLASLAERVIRDSGASQANILGPAARYAIIFFSAALALRQMGIAESIVNLAFGLMLGAIAVAVALAFGLGGRDVAARQLERWNQNLRVRDEIERPRRREPGAAD